MSIIEESLVCHKICSWLPMYDLNKIRGTSRAFKEIVDMTLKDVNVISTGGIYEYKGLYYTPYMDKLIDDFEIYIEMPSYKIVVQDDTEFLLVTPGVDHISFGRYIAFIKDDYLELQSSLLYSSNHMKRPDINDFDQLHTNCIDYWGWKYGSDKDISLKASLFESIEIHLPKNKEIIFVSQKEFDIMTINSVVTMTSRKGGSTIDAYLEILHNTNVPIKIMQFDMKPMIYC